MDDTDANEEPLFVVSESLPQHMSAFYGRQCLPGVCFMRGLRNDAGMRHFTRIARPITGSKIAGSNCLVAKT